MSEVLKFAEAILHGDYEHRRWLLEAARCWVNGEPIPPQNKKGEADE